MNKGEIIYWDFKENSNNLQQGKRPAYVIAATETHLLLAAITSKCKKVKQPTHISISGLTKESIVLLEQLFWVKRPDHVVCLSTVNKNLMKEINKKLLISLGIKKFRKSNEIHPFFHRGEIFANNEQCVVIIQNDVGNCYSPTTIVGDLVNGKMVNIYTIQCSDLKNMKYIGKKYNLYREIQKIVSFQAM